jgi:hypothetical protein
VVGALLVGDTVAAMLVHQWDQRRLKRIVAVFILAVGLFTAASAIEVIPLASSDAAAYCPAGRTRGSSNHFVSCACFSLSASRCGLISVCIAYLTFWYSNLQTFARAAGR